MFYIICTICAIFICNGCEKYTVTDYNNNEKHNIKQYTSNKKLPVSKDNNMENNIINKYNNEKYNINQYISSKLYTFENNNVVYNNEYLNNIDLQYSELICNNTQYNINNGEFNKNMIVEQNATNTINPETKKYYVCNKNASHLPIGKQSLLYSRNTYI